MIKDDYAIAELVEAFACLDRGWKGIGDAMITHEVLVEAFACLDRGWKPRALWSR